LLLLLRWDQSIKDHDYWKEMKPSLLDDHHMHNQIEVSEVKTPQNYHQQQTRCEPQVKE